MQALEGYRAASMPLGLVRRVDWRVLLGRLALVAAVAALTWAAAGLLRWLVQAA